jgi:hypothetical protein
MELGVLDGAQSFDDIVFSDRHGGSFGGGGNFSYSGR